MAVRVRQVERTTQPCDGAVLDLSNRLTRGLVAAYSFSNKGKNLTGDTALDGTIVNTMQFAPGAAGIGLVGAYQASDNYLNVARTTAVAYTNEVTFEALVRLKAPQTSTFPYISGIIGQYQSDGSGATPYYGPFLRLNNDAASGHARAITFCVTQSGTERQIVGPDLSDGVLTYIIGTYDGANIKLFVNGVRYATSCTGSFDNDSRNWIAIGSEYVAAYVGTNRCFNGDIYWAAIRNVGLTDEEGVSLSGSLNPWQLFEPEQIYVKSGAATSNTTLTPGNLALTLTGYTPTVTQTANVSLTPGALSLSLTGYAPTVSQTGGVSLIPGVSALTLTGYTPTVARTANVALTPNVLALTLTGYAPTVGQTTGLNLIPSTVALTVTGYAPTIAQTTNVFLTPSTLGLSLVGYAPTVTQTGVVVVTKGGAGRGSNLTLKQKKKLKAVVNQEWLKAEQTAKELLYERLGHAEPAKTKVERLTTVQSLGDVIAALQALSKETVTLPEQQAVIKSFEKSIDTKIVKTGERLVYVEDKVNETLGRIEKKIQNLEDLLIVIIDDLL